MKTYLSLGVILNHILVMISIVSCDKVGLCGSDHCRENDYTYWNLFSMSIDILPNIRMYCMYCNDKKGNKFYINE